MSNPLKYSNLAAARKKRARSLLPCLLWGGYLGAVVCNYSYTEAPDQKAWCAGTFYLAYRTKKVKKGVCRYSRNYNFFFFFSLVHGVFLLLRLCRLQQLHASGRSFLFPRSRSELPISDKTRRVNTALSGPLEVPTRTCS